MLLQPVAVHMNDQSQPEEFADVNEAVEDEWESETTPYERIRHVVAHAYSPVSADAVADDALTTPKTARKHLETLAEEGFVETSPGEHGGTLYRRSPESLVVEQAADILEHVTTDELVTRVTEMRERLNEYRTEYGVDSPEELAVERTNQTLSESGSAGQEIDPETVRDWKTLRRNLAFANAALSIGTAEQFVGEDDRSTDESIPA
ncbi:putative transcriptional regulator [Halorhabdus utahensis DSM 12940]|uniref:Putative transcriptional regulator n=2 Tax=Halorhabdus utahensis TaxID=146826 RepID=C7NUF1_HALUD|nr:putative transcriptional regulator [Halorhabdus utahensis DSM 12940]